MTCCVRKDHVNDEAVPLHSHVTSICFV